MKALRPSGRMVFENAKRVHESTVIKAPATYSRLGISSYMISPPLDSVADDSIYRQYGLIIRRRCFLRQEVLAAHGRFDVSPESQGNDAVRIWRVFDTCACQARDDPWGGRVEGSSQCRSRRSRKRFVMIPFGERACIGTTGATETARPPKPRLPTATRIRRRRRSIGQGGRGEPESSLDYPDPHIVHCVHLPHDENGWRWLR